VLQGWSKGTTTEHVTGLLFLALFAFAAGWGLRVFGLLPHK
jgi:hypothetical protein